LYGSLNEGSISRINDNPKDRFNSTIKQIIKHSIVFNNQTERITVVKIHRFVAGYQAHLRKVRKLLKIFRNKEQLERA